LAGDSTITSRRELDGARRAVLLVVEGRFVRVLVVDDAFFVFVRVFVVPVVRVAFDAVIAS
jgi:hypothetical protein